jgi:stearoyl-CoA desaturase (Delta-9 desaturase)
MIIIIFFLAHWFLSLFCQTFFLHRYASHKMFAMSKRWERFFYFLTFITQGSSFLNPRAYAIMHRMHHTYSDTQKDPHSPHFFKDIWQMMVQTKNIYMGYVNYKTEPEEAFKGNYPEWPWLDKFADSWVTRVLFALGYTAFYVVYATNPFLYLLLPIQWLMGPVQGAIVNWCGHKYGYSNFDNKDHSKNTLPLDFFLMGELFQNNHHKSPNRPNFAKRWFEFDPTFPVMILLSKLGIIKMRRVRSK